MSANAIISDRQKIEQIVASVLQARTEDFLSLIEGYRPLVVNVSARHSHLNQQAMDTLFGAGSTLTPLKSLYNGEFAAKEQINLVGTRNRMIAGVRILGPIRDYNQVELSFSEGIQLGIDVPVRISGDHHQSPGCTIVGPKGSMQLHAGVIRAKRHVHMGPEDLKKYNVKDGELMRLIIKGDCGVTMDNVVVRYGKNMKLEVHIDTDEGNACDLAHAKKIELIKQD